MPRLLIFIYIKILCVTNVADGWDYGAAVAAAIDVLPADAMKEGVCFDASGAARDVSKPSGAVDGAEGENERLGFVGWGCGRGR